MVGRCFGFVHFLFLSTLACDCKRRRRLRQLQRHRQQPVSVENNAHMHAICKLHQNVYAPWHSCIFFFFSFFFSFFSFDSFGSCVLGACCSSVISSHKHWQCIKLQQTLAWPCRRMKWKVPAHFADCRTCVRSLFWHEHRGASAHTINFPAEHKSCAHLHSFIYALIFWACLHRQSMRIITSNSIDSNKYQSNSSSCFIFTHLFVISIGCARVCVCVRMSCFKIVSICS